jgi:K+-transporting ATPase A subunit
MRVYTLVSGLAANTTWYDTTRGLALLIGRFAPIVLGVIIIVGGLIYFPMLILGPIGERIIG